MNTHLPSKNKKISLGISLKLFAAFWLVILSSVLISYLVTMTFRQSPIQEQATPEQLSLLNNYASKLDGKTKIKIKELQRKFHRKHNQDLIIKRLSDNKITQVNKRGWSPVKEYLKKHSLSNPVTIDFGFTKVTSSQPITLNNQQYQLLIARDIHRKRIVSWLSQLPIAIRIIMTLAISFLLCWLLAKSFTKPLIAIQKATKALGEGKLSTRIIKSDKRSDEFGELARHFNAMAEQLESNISAHQRLLGDVSHELRSPLTRLQLAVAMAEKNIGNSVEQQKHLARCEMEVERLDDMISDVLTLSRLEHNQNSFAPEKLNLNKLLTDIVEDCQYLASSKNISILLNNEGAHTILGDEKLLSSAISNIINNSIKYSQPEQKVIVNLQEENEKITIDISDQGVGVPEDMLEKLFIPFFRVADSRDRSSGGTGLGLAIAQQAILLHKGDIVAKNHSPSGLTIIISLPL